VGRIRNDGNKSSWVLFIFNPTPSVKKELLLLLSSPKRQRGAKVARGEKTNDEDVDCFTQVGLADGRDGNAKKDNSVTGRRAVVLVSGATATATDRCCARCCWYLDRGINGATTCTTDRCCARCCSHLNRGSNGGLVNTLVVFVPNILRLLGGEKLGDGVKMDGESSTFVIVVVVVVIFC